jgi:glycosyltransferase involved in cell wall biosynthesis
VRVLTVGNMYPPHHLGGYELVWRDSVHYLRKRGHEVRVLATDYRRNGVAVSGQETDTYRELRWYWRDHAWPAIPIRERVRLEQANTEILARHLASFDPDVIGWWSMGGMSMSLIERTRRLGFPAAGFVCEGWLEYGPSVDGWMRLTRWPLVGLLAEKLTGIPTRVRFSEAGPWLFPSELLRRRAGELRGLARTSVAHQGIDPAVFRSADRPEWRYQLLYAGRIDPRKGIDLAIGTLPMLPRDARLTIVGDGDVEHLGQLRKIAQREGVADRVAFLPAESQAHLRDRYADADVLVFPVRWQEPWGLVPLEAMAVGTPVIATGRGGSGEYLRDRENCLLFNPDEGPQALADAVRELARDEKLRHRLCRGGAATSAAIDPDSFNVAVERVLKQAASEHKDPAPG